MNAAATRRLLVIRHAKSDWGVAVPDVDRPLNGRGRRDAPAIGGWIRDHGLVLQAATISPSARTRATWALLAEAAGITFQPEQDRAIYLGEAEDLAEAVRALDPGAANAALVGHAPGCEEFVEWATGGAGEADALAAMRAKYPTAAVAVLALQGAWDALQPGSARLEAFAVCRG